MKSFDKQKFLEWLKATAIRVVRTMAQVAAGYITVGLTIQEIDWLKMLSVMAVAGLYSIITNIVSKPPEAEDDGEVIIDPEGDKIGNLTIFTNQNDLMFKKKLVLNVKNEPLPDPDDKDEDNF